MAMDADFYHTLHDIELELSEPDNNKFLSNFHEMFPWIDPDIITVIIIASQNDLVSSYNSLLFYSYLKNCHDFNQNTECLPMKKLCTEKIGLVINNEETWSENDTEDEQNRNNESLAIYSKELAINKKESKKNYNKAKSKHRRHK